MRRLLQLVLLVLIPAPSVAHADGCPLPCSGQNSSPVGSKLVFVQPNGPGWPLVAYDTRTGRPQFNLPPGISSADGRWYASSRPFGSGTRVHLYDVSTGMLFASSQVRRHWALEGVSPSGRWLALTRRAVGRTRIEIVGPFAGRVVHVLRLKGNFEVETLSLDGKKLFLIEHLQQRRYRVRQYDLTHEHLLANPLRAAGVRLMAGYAWSGVASPDGRWLLTLYLSTARRTAFVHSLDLARSKPVCVGLPSGGVFRRLKEYSLTLDPRGQTLFAANPALGVVAELDLAGARVYRTTRFPRSAPGSVRRAATLSTISRNGRTLYFGAGRRLWAFDAAHGVVRGPYATGGELVGVGYGPRDRRVYAVRKDGRMLAFDAATGRRVR